MNRKRKDRRSLALALLLAVGLLLPVAVSSQGLFKRGGVTDENYYGYGGTAEQATGLFGNRNAQILGDTNGGITNADFGEEVPLGCGIAILLGAGFGYVALKKKEDEQ